MSNRSEEKEGMLSEREGYTVTVRLSLEPGRLEPETSSYSTDTHTVLTGQCPLPSVEDLDLPTLLAASEPVKVTWDRNEGTRIENIGSTVSTFDNISAMLQKLCPSAAQNLTACVSGMSRGSGAGTGPTAGGSHSKNLTGEEFLSSVCNVRLTQQEWSRVSAAHCGRGNQQQHRQQEVRERSVQRCENEKWERSYIVQQQAYTKTVRKQTRSANTVEAEDAKPFEDLLQQMVLLQDVLSDTIQRVQKEQKERELMPPQQKEYFSSTTKQIQLEDCRVSEEVRIMLIKLRRLYDGDTTAMPQHCCKGGEKIKQPHVHGELNGMPVVITLIEMPYPKKKKRSLSSCCAKKEKEQEPYRPSKTTSDTQYRTFEEPCYVSQSVGTTQQKTVSQGTEVREVARVNHFAETPTSPPRMESCSRGLCSRQCSGRLLDRCHPSCPGMQRPDGKRKAHDDPALYQQDCPCSYVNFSDHITRSGRDEQPGPGHPVAYETRGIPPEEKASPSSRSKLKSASVKTSPTHSNHAPPDNVKETVSSGTDAPSSDDPSPAQAARPNTLAKGQQEAFLHQKDATTSMPKVMIIQTSLSDDDIDMPPANEEPTSKDTGTQPTSDHHAPTSSTSAKERTPVERKSFSKEANDKAEIKKLTSSEKRTSQAVDAASAPSFDKSETKPAAKKFKINTIFNAQKHSRVHKRLDSSSSSETFLNAVSTPPIQARLAKKYGMHDIMQSARAPPCTRDVVLNDEIHSEFPYAASFNSLPLDEADAAEISARIERARSSHGIASAAQVYMAKADARFRQRNTSARVTSQSEVFRKCSNLSLMTQGKIKEQKRLLYKYLWQELQKYNERMMTNDEPKATSNKNKKSVDYGARDKLEFDTYQRLINAAKSLSKQKTDENLQRKIAGCRRSTPIYPGQLKQITKSKEYVDNTTSFSGSVNSSQWSFHASEFANKSIQVTPQPYKKNKAFQKNVSDVRKSVSDTSLIVQTSRNSGSTDLRQELHKKSSKILWALSKIRNFENASDIWDIFSSKKSKR